MANGRLEIWGRDFSPPTKSDRIRFCPMCLPEDLEDDDFAADDFEDDDFAADDWPADDLAEHVVDAVEGSAAPTFGDCVRFLVL